MHKADAQALRLMSVIGGKADIGSDWRCMARSLMTPSGHAHEIAPISGIGRSSGRASASDFLK